MDWPRKDDAFEKRRSRREIRKDFDEEFGFHLEMRTQELIDRGFSPEEARREALRRYGELGEARKACVSIEARRDRRREMHRVLEDLRIDILHALRQTVRQPLFAIVVVATLAIGIGSSTAIVSVADQLLFQPLPYADADRLVTLWEWDEERDERTEVAAGNYISWVERASSFESLGLAEPTGVDLIGDGPPVALRAWSVTPDFFGTMGVRPIIGRAFEDRDYAPIADCKEYRCYADPVAMLSYEFWQRQFGGDPAIVGQDVELDHEQVTIVGILPPGIDYPERKPIWQPLILSEERRQDRRADYMLAIARLAPGVDAERATADLTRIADQLSVEFPATNRNEGFKLVPLRDEILGTVRQGITILFGASMILLLIACANVANLLLVRGAAKTNEAAVRAAIGAGRGRLVRQYATESLVLAVLGGVAGAGVGMAGVAVLRRIAPPETPRIDTLALDPSALPIALGLAVATSLLFGLLPALRSSRVSTSALMRSSLSSASSPGRVRLRAAIVCGEIALALVLLVSVGLLGKSFTRLTANDLGFQPEGRMSLQMFLWDRNPSAEERISRMSEFEERFRAIPGVSDVGIVSSLPFHPHAIAAVGAFRLDGMLDDEEPTAYTTIASPGYFKTMAIPIVRGRAFKESDDGSATLVAIVSDRFAETYFPNGDAIGKQITFGAMSRPIERTIVGIAGDVRPRGFDAEPRLELFIPYLQSGTGHTTFVVSAALSEGALTKTLHETVAEVDPLQPIYHMESMESLIRHTIAERQFHLLVIGAFTLAALLLAFIGTYGLMSFTTRQRSSEIGVRMAIGARPREIVTMILRDGLVLGLVGSLVGVVCALGLSGFLSGMLYSVEPTDSVTFLQVVLAMIVVACTSALVPAWRMARLDPARTLREE